MDENNAIVEINKAELALERANDIHEMLILRDTSAAYELLTNAQGFKEAAQKAKIFQLKAERKAGDWLAVNVDHAGGNSQLYQDGTADPLPEGISRNESSRWQLEASLPEEKFNDWVDDSLSSGKEITATALQKLAKDHKIEKNRGEFKKQELPINIYDIIYADPPWRYDNSGFYQSAESQYPTMSIDEICNMPISKLSHENTVLFLWATSPLLPEAIQVVEAWGFTYRASMVWVKDRAPGMGWWVNTKHELLLIASKNTNHPIKKCDSVIFAGVTRHSKKPEEFYECIESMYPNAKRIELFSRNARNGWTAWGNEKLQ